MQPVFLPLGIATHLFRRSEPTGSHPPGLAVAGGAAPRMGEAGSDKGTCTFSVCVLGALLEEANNGGLFAECLEVV